MLSGKSFIYIKKVVDQELNLEGNLIQHLSILNVDRLTLFRIGFFGPPHISYNDETWYSYTLPKEDPKNV